MYHKSDKYHWNDYPVKTQENYLSVCLEFTNRKHSCLTLSSNHDFIIIQILSRQEFSKLHCIFLIHVVLVI